MKQQQFHLQFPTQVTTMLYEIDIPWQLRKSLDQIWNLKEIHTNLSQSLENVLKLKSFHKPNKRKRA